jgi:hypothetical protein
MRRLVLRQRHFTDICSIAIVTLALFQRSVMDLKKCGKQIKRKQLAIQHTPAILRIYLATPASHPQASAPSPLFGTRGGGGTHSLGGEGEPIFYLKHR